jgi:hypothetical protein
MKGASGFDLSFKDRSDRAAVLIVLKNDMIWMAEFCFEL